MNNNTLTESKAIGGTFTLSYDTGITDPIPFDATPEEIDEAIRKVWPLRDSSLLDVELERNIKST